MKKSKFRKPYKENGQTNFRFTNKKAGVYLIKNKKGEIVYVGMSESDLYKTMYRHFQSWEDRRQIRVTYPKFKGFTVRVVLTTPTRTRNLERALILKLKPKDNPDKLERYKINHHEKTVLNVYEDKQTEKWEVLDNCPF